MSRLYSQLFARFCRHELGQLATRKMGTSLNAACYMLWDVAVLKPRPDVPSEREVDAACLDVMRGTLNLPHLACQESALHGLGHWQHAYAARVADIVDEFLRSNRGMPPALLVYARSAREGRIH
jgi:hypothetical protein